MSRPINEDKGVRFSLYLKQSQLKWLDEQVEKENTTRTKYIEKRVFPEELQKLELKRGDYKKGDK